MSGMNGDLYNFLSMNCQDFSEYLINNLKTNGWGNPQRIEKLMGRQTPDPRTFPNNRVVRFSKDQTLREKVGTSVFIVAEVRFDAAVFLLLSSQG